MKKILITGANSYIGTSFEAYMKQFPEYQIDTVDMIDGSWREKDFSIYDVVFHVAGLAHAEPKPEMRTKYYQVNTDLAIETAKYAKACGVGQFVFMSSIIAYGSNNTYIDESTAPQPENFYGDSKLQADKGLQALTSEGFCVASIRPPMIYGKGSKGNYPRLSKLARRIPVFPKVENQRSMLHIDNLCSFIKKVIEEDLSGIFYPQNAEYVNTSALVKEIRFVYGKKTWLVPGFSGILRFLAKKNTTFNKLFGDLVYAKELSGDFSYCVCNLKESIARTEV